MSEACYRKLQKYKYQLVEDYSLDVKILDHEIDHPYMRLVKNDS